MSLILFKPSLFHQALAALTQAILRAPDALCSGASIDVWELEARAAGFPKVNEADRATLKEAMPLLERAALEEAMGALEAGEVIEEVGPANALAWRIAPEGEEHDGDEEDDPESEEDEPDSTDEPATRAAAALPRQVKH